MKYWYITNKDDDYGSCRSAVYYGKENDIKKYVYFYKEIPKEHWEILKIYFENLNDGCYQDFGYKILKDYLNEYYW